MIMIAYRTVIKYIIIFLLTITLGLFAKPFDTFAQSSKQKKIYRINIEVSGDDYLIPIVNSFLSREFRALKDVEIVSEGYQWQFIVQIYYVDIRKKSVGLNYIIFLNAKEDLRKYAILSKEQETKDIANLFLSLPNLGSLVLYSYYVRPKESLSHLCRDLVAEFDGMYLEADRRRNR